MNAGHFLNINHFVAPANRDSLNWVINPFLAVGPFTTLRAAVDPLYGMRAAIGSFSGPRTAAGSFSGLRTAVGSFSDLRTAVGSFSGLRTAVIKNKETNRTQMIRSFFFIRANPFSGPWNCKSFRGLSQKHNSFCLIHIRVGFPNPSRACKFARIPVEHLQDIDFILNQFEQSGLSRTPPTHAPIPTPPPQTQRSPGRTYLHRLIEATLTRSSSQDWLFGYLKLCLVPEMTRRCGEDNVLLFSNN